MNVNEYNTGLFDCFEDGNSCTEAWFCAHCFVSQQYNMLNYQIPQPNWVLTAGMLALDVFITGGLSLFVMSLANRTTARQRLGLTARNAMVDFATAVCCRPCSDCQVYREMSLRGQWQGGICLIDKPYAKVGVLVVAPEEISMGVPVGGPQYPQAINVEMGGAPIMTRAMPVSADNGQLYAMQPSAPRDGGYDRVATNSPKAIAI